jgi:hypothetical protein
MNQVNQRRFCCAKWTMHLLVAATLGGCVVADNTGQPYVPVVDAGAPPAIPAQEQIEVLSRGPVHEAFAEPVNLEIQAGLVATVQPPPIIEEVPPAERPQGDQYVWIPGYWSWDAERSGYVWVSACWRVAPPRMSWMPGYWSPVPGGWEWISGYWAPAGIGEVEYLPAPPMITDVEAFGPAPAPDMIWIPPCMYWTRGQYVRRDGYWLAAQPDWVWVPSHYLVTPRGYIFADGHWDYSLERRGVLFAPVLFPVAYHGRPSFTFSPSIVLDLGLLHLSLFAYPRYSHYYFGDYYDDAYLGVGIFPWFESRMRHSWYDPVYEHARWRNHRSEPRWEEHERDNYRRCREDRNLRPARTYREQESRLARMPEPQRRSLQMIQPISVAVARRATPMKFERINADEREKISRQAKDVRTFRDERNRREATSATGVTPPPMDGKGGVPRPISRPVVPGQPAGDKGRDSAAQPPIQRPVVPGQPTGDKGRDSAAQPPIQRPVVPGQPTGDKGRDSAAQPPIQRPVVPGQLTGDKGRDSAAQPPIQRPVVPGQPTGDKGRDSAAQPPIQRPVAPVQPSGDKGRDSVAQPPVQRPVVPVQPPRDKGRDSVAQPPVQRPVAPVQPSGDRGRSPAVKAPAERRAPAFVPPPATQAAQPERVPVPTPPIVGGSGGSGIFRKGPPARPDGEDEDKEGNPIRK